MLNGWVMLGLGVAAGYAAAKMACGCSGGGLRFGLTVGAQPTPVAPPVTAAR